MVEISETGLGEGINYELQMKEELSVCRWRMPKADVTKKVVFIFFLWYRALKNTEEDNAAELSPLRGQRICWSGDF